jgi:hypothetical protein
MRSSLLIVALFFAAASTAAALELSMVPVTVDGTTVNLAMRSIGRRRRGWPS